MKHTKYLPLKWTGEPWIGSHSSCLLDEGFMERYTIDGQTRKNKREKEHKQREKKEKEKEQKLKELKDKRLLSKFLLTFIYQFLSFYRKRNPKISNKRYE